MKFFLFVLLVGSLFSCEVKNDNLIETLDCYVENSTESIEWLKQEIAEFSSDEYSYVLKSQYNNEIVFVIGICNPLVNAVFLVKNCSGERIGYIGNDSIPFSVHENGTIIWSSTKATEDCIRIEY